MHPHRTALLIAAGLGILVIGLPWVSVLGLQTVYGFRTIRRGSPPCLPC